MKSKYYEQRFYLNLRLVELNALIAALEKATNPTYNISPAFTPYLNDLLPQLKSLSPSVQPQTQKNQ